MAKKIKQQYGIKYPFTNDGNGGSIVDLNTTVKSKIRSILMHIVFTPKGQKLRDPNFGTDLVKFLFEPNMEETGAFIKENINSAVGEYLPNVTIGNIEVLRGEDDPYEAYVKIIYSISNGSETTTDNIIVSV